MIVDPELEPFTEDAIEIRKRMPDLLMMAARIAFDNTYSDTYSDDLRAEAHAMLKERSVRLAHLAEIGLAAPRSSQRVN